MGYSIVPCICPAGYVGDYCEWMLDACADDPCFVNVTCMSGVGYNMWMPGFDCWGCPFGMVGDGFECSAVGKLIYQ